MTHLLTFLLGAALVWFLNNRGLNKSHAQLIDAVCSAAAQLTSLRLELQAYWRTHEIQKDVEQALRGELAAKEKELEDLKPMLEPKA